MDVLQQFIHRNERYLEPVNRRDLIDGSFHLEAAVLPPERGHGNQAAQNVLQLSQREYTCSHREAILEIPVDTLRQLSKNLVVGV